MPNKKRVYWDSCVFISYFEKTPSRIVTIDELLDQAKRGELEILTSTLSIVEVAFVVGERTSGLSAQVVSDMDSFWADSEIVRLIEPSVIVAREARDLIRYAMGAGLKKIRGMDATHLASARIAAVAEIHSYNYADFDYLEPHTGIPAVAPYLVQGTLGLTAATPAAPNSPTGAT